MFVFYGTTAVATGYRDIIGISVDPNNVGCHKTCDTTDPTKMNFVAYPLAKPDTAEAWVYIPDERSWLGKSTGYKNQGGFDDPVYIAALRPCSFNMSCSYTELIQDAVTIKIGKHGVCFYNNPSKYVMLGYCPPESNYDVIFTSAWSQHCSGVGHNLAYCPVIVSNERETFDGKVVDYQLMGVPGVTMTWNYQDSSSTPASKIVRVFWQLNERVLAFDGRTEISQSNGTKSPLYEIYYMTGFELARFIRETPTALIIDGEAGTNGTNGQFVVR